MTFVEVTLCDWPKALNCTLESIPKQSVIPIIICGKTTQETFDLIKEWQLKIKSPIIHSCQEDEGFRAAASRNKAM
jgi:hypothetical protein